MKVQCACTACSTEMEKEEAFEKDGLYYCGEDCVTAGHDTKAQTSGCGHPKCECAS